MAVCLQQHYANHVAVNLPNSIPNGVISGFCSRYFLRHSKIDGRAAATAMSSDVGKVELWKERSGRWIGMKQEPLCDGTFCLGEWTVNRNRRCWSFGF